VTGGAAGVCSVKAEQRCRLLVLRERQAGQQRRWDAVDRSIVTADPPLLSGSGVDHSGIILAFLTSNA